MSTRSLGQLGIRLAFFAYLFFLSIEAMGEGMKASFKEQLAGFLRDNAASFTELTSFVIGVLGTSLVQSSSTVTSMAVKLTQDGIVPLLISIGIVHGANLGTSVTSSIVAFFAEARALPRNPVAAIKALLTEPRGPGFKNAVATAVVHGLFNAVMVTLLLLVLELPFGLIHRLSEASSSAIGTSLAGSGVLLDVLAWVSPSTWTEPLVDGALEVGVPGGVVVMLGFVLLFLALRGFARTMKAALVASGDQSPSDLGDLLVGKHPADTFLRGLLLTILVQSSSATTSMVVPLAAMGLFSIRRIFPFILGANIGTTTTALLAAASAVGRPGFEEGLTIAMAHFYLNTIAVVIVVAVPWLRESVLAATNWLASGAAKSPAVLLGYLAVLTLGMPAVVFVLPTAAAGVVLAAGLVALLVWPRVRGHHKPVDTRLAAAA